MNNNPTIFPPVEYADEDGLLAISRQIDAEMLFDSYTHGIFPWPVEERHILWFSPPLRAVLDLRRLHVSKSFKRDFKNKGFEFRINTAFPEVIRRCSVRNNGDGTWITPKIIKAYEKFHKMGFAFSFEAYNVKGELAGGLYGIWINSFFAGESMFYQESGASKFALVNTLEFLRDRAGLRWIDTQMRTPLFERLGTVDVPREQYMKMLENELKRKLPEEVQPLHSRQREYYEF
ncbi:MAG: leucyl/phenylalanyl-tRNA--protein transferase [Victivallales bacterium]|nr:leucyl/phenylalanyl-tRNA--protein transferase [Victivallales bacterium]